MFPDRGCVKINCDLAAVRYLLAKRDLMENAMRFIHARKGFEVIGADGVLCGVVDRVDAETIDLVRGPPPPRQTRAPRRFIHKSVVAKVEGQQVFLSVNADAAVMVEEDGKGAPSWSKRHGASGKDRRLGEV
jgi:hypothetical protein